MPGEITFDDAFAEVPESHADGARITIDDALADREANTKNVVGEKGQQLYGLNGPLRQAPDLLPPEESHFGASTKAAIAADPNTKRRILAESLFPNDPNGINRVGFAEGVPVYVDDEGKLRRVSGKGAQFGADTVANLPEMAGATAGALLTGSPVAGGAVGAAGGRALKRGISELVFDEPATAGSVAREMGAEAALNVVTGGAFKAVGSIAGRGKIVNFTPENVRTAEEARALIKDRTGIDVDLAQASGNRMLLGIRNYASTFPGKSAEIIQAADEASQGQLDTAVHRVMDLVGRSTPQEVATANGVNAAQAVIATARAQVYNDVRPLYDAAYQAVPVVRDAGILNFLQLPRFQKAFKAGQELYAIERGAPVRPKSSDTEILTQRNPDGSFVRNTNRRQSTLTDADQVSQRVTEGTREDLGDGLTRVTRQDRQTTAITNPSLRELDYTKRALDAEIETLRAAGSRQRAAALQRQRDQFVSALDAIPNSQWQTARRRFGELIEDNVAPLENGAVGVLARIENPRMASAAAKVLGDKNITADEIRRTRAAISQQNPEDWNVLVRQYINDSWNTALKETQSGQAVNPAGKLRQALFGTPSDKARMQAMLPAPAVQAFDDLMTAAQSLARTPAAGSNTALKLDIKEQLASQGGVAFKFLTTPRAALRNTYERRALEQNTLAVTEAILDPEKRAQLRQVVKMQPSTQKALVLIGILGGETAKPAVSGEEELLPPAYAQ